MAAMRGPMNQCVVSQPVKREDFTRRDRKPHYLFFKTEERNQVKCRFFKSQSWRGVFFLFLMKLAEIRLRKRGSFIELVTQTRNFLWISIFYFIFLAEFQGGAAPSE